MVVIDDAWILSPEAELFREQLFTSNLKPVNFGVLDDPCENLSNVSKGERIRVAVYGKGSVGKSIFLESLICDRAEFPGRKDARGPTPGLFTKDVFWPVRVGGKIKIMHIEFLDVGEKAVRCYEHLLPAYLHKVNCVIFVFLMSDKNSLESIPKSVAQLTKVIKKENKESGAENTDIGKIAVGLSMHNEIESDLAANGIGKDDIHTFTQNNSIYAMPFRLFSTEADANFKQMATLFNAICQEHSSLTTSN
eukprot:Nk52_evm91s226 gene=Nk52_evmTU91s226